MLAPMLKLIYHSMSFVGIYFTIKLLYEYFNRKGIEAKKDGDWFYKVIFFPDLGIRRSRVTLSSTNGEPPKVDLLDNIGIPPDRPFNLDNSTSLAYLLKFIKSARKSLDLCLLIFTLKEVQVALIEAKKRGVHIRVIIDKTMADCNGSSLPYLQKENIPVVRGPTNVMMHHKFALADATETGGLVATGSVNWTWGAVTSNYENMIITNNPDIVCPFKSEFDRLWSVFSNSK